MLQTPELSISLGQASSPGPKSSNDDFYGALLPEGSSRDLKGCVFAIADGISTSDKGQEAAETCIKLFLTDYMATPDSWTVKTAASTVIQSANSWLQAQTSYSNIHDIDRGYVCTLSALILKGRTAHIFNAGDSRVWRLHGNSLELLSNDHRTRMSGGNMVLTRAMGAEPTIEIDYKKIPANVGDVFLLTTDGMHEAWDKKQAIKLLKSKADPEEIAQKLLKAAEKNADDNLTLQIIRLDNLPIARDVEIGAEAEYLPLLDEVKPGDVIDGYTIARELHANHRSALFLAKTKSGDQVAFKTPAIEMKQDPEALRRFMIEEWVARRLDNSHLLSSPKVLGERGYLYTVTNFIEGQTLRQYIHDNETRSLDDVRSIVTQIIKGLRAMHRREMIHQDLRPENIMIDKDGHVTLIDFGSAYISGVQETGPDDDPLPILGTFQYTAPEYFLEEYVSWAADLFSLGVLTYELITGELPYGATVARIESEKDRNKLRYKSGAEHMPAWVDEAIRKAVDPRPERRFEALSEFEAALHKPTLQYVKRNQKPIFERDPVRLWQIVSFVLACMCVALATQILN